MFGIKKINGMTILRKIFKLMFLSKSRALFLVTYDKKFYSATFSALQLTDFCDFLLLTISCLFHYNIITIIN